MFERAIAPDLQRRMAERGESTGVIASRVVRTWGMSESGLAEALADHIARPRRLRRAADRATGRPAGRAPPSPSWPAGSRGSRCGSRCGPTTRRARVGAARRRGGRDPARSWPTPAGDVVFGVDDEAIEDAVARALVDRRADPRAGRVAHRRPGRVAAGQRARGQRLVPRLGRLLRLRGQVRRPRRAGGPGGVRGGGPGHGRRRPPGPRVPTSGCPSPGWPVPTRRTASRPGTVFVGLARSGSRRPRRSGSTCPATATGSASTRPSPPSTCCAGRSGVRRRARGPPELPRAWRRIAPAVGGWRGRGGDGAAGGDRDARPAPAPPRCCPAAG